MKAHGYAALTAKAELQPYRFERREPGPHDVVLEITHCGICHSDLCYVDSYWYPGIYPMVPGHEIVGRIVRVGEAVTKFRVGDRAAIGNMVDSCRQCDACRNDLENMCAQGATLSYNSVERDTGRPTYGGYSNLYVADEAYVLKVPDTLDPAGAAPLLCAGITAYSPLRHWKIGPGARVGVVGLGGLGHIAIKLACAMGASVTVFTTSPGKVAAARALGASHVVISTDDDQMAAVSGQLDFIFDSVSEKHAIDGLLAALRNDGTLCVVGVPDVPLEVKSISLIMGRKILTGSPAGGIAETQEMLDFCGEHGITADVEVIAMQDVNAAYARLRRGDVRYRFVIDLATLPPAD